VPNFFPAAAAAHAYAERGREREQGVEAHRNGSGRLRAREMEEDGGVGFLGSLLVSKRKLERRVLRQHFGIGARGIYRNHLYRLLS